MNKPSTGHVFSTHCISNERGFQRTIHRLPRYPPLLQGYSSAQARQKPQYPDISSVCLKSISRFGRCTHLDNSGNLRPFIHETQHLDFEDPEDVHEGLHTLDVHFSGQFVLFKDLLYPILANCNVCSHGCEGLQLSRIYQTKISLKISMVVPQESRLKQIAGNVVRKL